MPNVLHKNFTLDNNHAVPARVYADITARDADTTFNTDVANLYKDVFILSPASTYRLATVSPLFIELSNVTSGNVTTSDTLLATQLLVGNGGTDIVTEPDLIWNGTGLGIGITPVNILHVYEDTANGGPSAGLTIEQDGIGDAMLHFLLTGGTRWVVGIDSDVSDAFKIQQNTTFNTQVGLTITTAGDFGLGIVAPIGKLHVSGTPGDTAPLNSWSQLGAFGGTLHDFYGSRNPEGIVTALEEGDFYRSFALGSSSGLFIFKGTAPANTGWEEVLTGTSGSGVTTSDVLTANQLLLGNGGVDIVTEPDLVWTGSDFGIGIASPVSRVHIFEDTIFTGPSAGLTIEQHGIGDVMLQFLLTGGMRWIMGIDNSDGTTFKINDSVNFTTDGAINILATTELIGFGTNAPDTKLDINGLTGDALRLRSGNTSGFTRNQMRLSHDDGLNFTHLVKTRHNEFNQFSNAIDIFLWDPDNDLPAELGTLPVMSLKGDGKIGVGKTSPSGIVDILSLFGDTTAIIQMESASNAGTTKLRTGNRNPNAAVTGLGPDVYYADRGALSGTYENRSVAGDQVWLKRSVLPVNIVELHNSTELDDLASAGVITISVNTTWHVRGALTTANRIVINAGILFNITGEYNVTASITYTGTLTFVSGSGSFRTFAQLNLISASTGTFLDITGGSGVNLDDSSYIGWDDLGSVASTGFISSQSRFLNIGSGFTFTNTFLVDVSVVLLIGSPLNGTFFTINLNDPISVLSFVGVQANALGTGSIFDLNTRINNDVSIKINGCSVRTGDIFKQSVLTDATINSVADGSIATGTITAMADNGSGGTTISSTTTYFEDEEVVISGTTSYNGTFQIFNVVAGMSFDIITTFVADDATGSVDTERLTLTLAGGHGIITGDPIKVIDTNFYNGFNTTLNVSVNDITINGTFISTNTGSIERELSVDQTDRRISAFRNFDFTDSHSIACASVNDNSTAVGTIVNNTFTDLVFGTVADALIVSTTTERWRMTNELNGTFEDIGVEPFDGSITFDFTVVSGGGTVDFRFKWVVDRGAGFVDLDDNVESLVAVGSDAQSVTKTFPLKTNNGDLIKPQITRNSGSSSITVAYATLYVSM